MRFYKNLFILLFLYNNTFLSAIQISVTSLPFANQLPSNSVQRVFQDKEGYIWMGSEYGLFRYDGYHLLAFTSDRTYPNLLTNNTITYLAEDESNLWIGTKKGVNLLDKKTYNIRPLDNDDILNTEIKSICVTADKNIWIGTTNGLYRFNPDYSLRKAYNQLPVQSVTHIYEDAQMNIWITVWGNGLYKYNPENDYFIAFPPVGDSNNPFRIFQDKTGQRWIGTWGNGLYLFNPDKNGDEMYIPMKTFNKVRKSNDDTFYSLVQDDHYQYIWAMSLLGVYVFEYTGDGKLQQKDVSQLFRDNNNTFSEIIKDANGNLWIGTFKEGVLQINFDKPIIQNYNIPLIKNRTGVTTYLTVIHRDEDEIWFNQNRYGLGNYNIKSGELNLYGHLSSANLNVSQVNCINTFTNYPGEIWIGAGYIPYIYRVKKQGKKLKLLHTIDLNAIVESAGPPRFLFEDRKNNSWIACSNHLFFIPDNSKEIIPIHHPFAEISGITEDTEGGICISSFENGLYRILVDRDKPASKPRIINYNRKNGLLANRITSLCAGKNGQIWMTTEEGNVIMHDIFLNRSSNMNNLANLLDDRILNLITDDFGNLWMVTDRKIIVYSPENGTIRDFTETDGVGANSFTATICYKDKTGKLLFGGYGGISVFDLMEKSPECTYKNKLFFTDIKINNQSLLNGKNNRKFNTLSNYLEINPQDKNIEINFSSLNYTYPSKIRYAYQLEGKDDEWVYTNKNRRFATYNQLGKGKYRFRVKATDENGVWKSEETVLTIYRHPAYYETPLAYIVYTLMSLLLAYLIFNYTRRRIRVNNRLKIAQIEKGKEEELNQLKFRFFTNISHEFRTPLSLIISPLEILIKQEKNESYKQKLSKIHKNAKDLLSLVNQLLDFRKLEMKGEELHASYGDLVEFVEIYYQTFKDIADNEQKDICLSITEEHLYMLFDKDKLHKILNNLLSNAFKYTAMGDRIVLSLKKTEKDEKKYAEITVSDSGAGIAPENIDKIFDRFYQLENPEIAKPGSGIGLHLVKEYVNLHSGQITVQSTPGKGSVFTVLIPANTGIASAEKIEPGNIIPEKQMPSGNKTTKSFERKKILLVEDNDEFRRFLVEQLTGSFRILEASNGEEGEQEALKRFPDLIITDVMMPKVDGLELCSRIKNNILTSHIPIIMLTSHASDEAKLTGYEAGADEYISKPFNFDILLMRIQKLIEQQELRKENFRKTIEVSPSSITITPIDEQLMQRAILCIEQNMDNTEYSIIDLGTDIGLSRTHLWRKIRSITGEKPTNFIRSVRLKKAAQMVGDTDLRICEIADRTGFSNIKYFNIYFKEAFGLTPTQYRMKNGTGCAE
jgi:signal transduction histidine kinase/DNA-binding response OmpR family regulator/ligand-binding sensor domain-containing protein